jgi:predicted PurR-regulated permease PerM
VVLQPFVTALLWAAVLWLATAPIHERVLVWVGQRRAVAAAVMTLGVSLVLLVPVFVVGFSVADSARDLTHASRAWLASGPLQPPAWVEQVPIVGGRIAAYWREVASDSQSMLREAQRLVEPATAWILSGGLAVGRGIGEIALSILIAFFLYRDATAMRERFRAGAARIAGPRADHLVEVAVGTVRSVVYGILGTALLQGVMAGVGLLISGVPGAVLLGLLTFFVSVVPAGPPLIWGPATFWLYQTGSPGWAIFMLVWGIALSSVDNFVKPWLISQGSTLPFILIFFGVVGGALAFGFIGVFLGPTLLAVGYRVVLDWSVAAREAAVAPSAPR